MQSYPSARYKGHRASFLVLLFLNALQHCCSRLFLNWAEHPSVSEVTAIFCLRRDQKRLYIEELKFQPSPSIAGDSVSTLHDSMVILQMFVIQQVDPPQLGHKVVIKMSQQMAAVAGK